ncbi:hypothetical protein HOU00_gp336 [Caulobacter phage CcrPW]|uniref:Lipoprotein n=1 Tax=Caulobacter phage CcrPW TaxID=2283271 RepID=A0A385EDK6_9CAUD|nr:hypothetical protein HOU00_gp336 [Caulobacter phage CcrPW]AXQ68789.1 hypothetical protein CcrPW_gp250 [Caulobacter phage CcrPW]
MKLKIIAMAGMLAGVAIAGAACAQAVGEDSTWKFRTPSENVILQQNLDKIDLQKAGYYDKLKNGAYGLGGGAGAAGGLLGGGASTISNYYSITNQTTNNCSSSGSVGSPISCGSGSITSSGVSQSTVGSSLDSNTALTGNTVTSTGNKTQVGGTINNNQQPQQ